MQPGDHAARAVAALAGGAAVEVPHAVAEGRVRARRRLDGEQLVEAYPAPAVAHAADQVGRQRPVRRAPVQHGEVVADAVHLAEADRHQRPGSGASGARLFSRGPFASFFSAAASRRRPCPAAPAALLAAGRETEQQGQQHGAARERSSHWEAPRCGYGSTRSRV
jgi:hypothetical protein